ncbi:MAG: hypothetical protein ACREXX_02110, partial [Gammaproteobacteria bacterium]
DEQEHHPSVACGEVAVGHALSEGVSSTRGAPSKTTIRSEAAPNFVKKLSRRLATSVSFGSSS